MILLELDVSTKQALEILKLKEILQKKEEEINEWKKSYLDLQKEMEVMVKIIKKSEVSFIKYFIPMNENTIDSNYWKFFQ